MSASYRIARSLETIFTSLEGVLTDDDLLGHQQKLESDPDFDPAFAQLIDCRGVTEVALESETIRTIATPAVYAPGAKRAVVATRDAAYGLARMYERLRGGESDEVRVFRDIKEARRWLELD
jgi:hypothetical protein